MYSATVQHGPHMQSNPAVNVAGAPVGARVGMSTNNYPYSPGPGHYPGSVPQQYTANHSHQMSAPMYRSTDLYGRPIAHGSSPGNMSSAYDTRSDPMYNQMYVQRRPPVYSGTMYPTGNTIVPHPRADGYPHAGGNVHGSQFMHSSSQMVPSSMNYSIATSGDPTPTQPTLHSSSGQQAAPATPGNQSLTGPPGSAYSLPPSSHLSSAAPVSSVSHNSLDNSWSNLAAQSGPAHSAAASTSAATGATNPSEVPSSLSNSVSSSVAAEGANIANQTAPTSAPSAVPPPGSVPPRTPQQMATPGVPTLPVNQVNSVSNVAGQPMQPMHGMTRQAPPPTAVGGTGEGFPPQGTQQQQSFARLTEQSLIKSDVSYTYVRMCDTLARHLN